MVIASGPPSMSLEPERGQRVRYRYSTSQARAQSTGSLYRVTHPEVRGNGAITKSE